MANNESQDEGQGEMRDQEQGPEEQQHPSSTRRARLAKIRSDFSYVPVPVGTEQAAAVMAVRDASIRMASLFEERCPHTPEKTLAIRKLQEAMFWAIQSISHR